MVAVHFSDFFDVPPEALEEYGAFNISLINDLPLFEMVPVFWTGR